MEKIYTHRKQEYKMQNTKMVKNANLRARVRTRFFNSVECSEPKSEVISYTI